MTVTTKAAMLLIRSPPEVTDDTDPNEICIRRNQRQVSTEEFINSSSARKSMRAFVHVFVEELHGHWSAWLSDAPEVAFGGSPGRFAAPVERCRWNLRFSPGHPAEYRILYRPQSTRRSDRPTRRLVGLDASVGTMATDVRQSVVWFIRCSHGHFSTENPIPSSRFSPLRRWRFAQSSRCRFRPRHGYGSDFHAFPVAMGRETRQSTCESRLQI